jgi:hypothetical protein
MGGMVYGVDGLKIGGGGGGMGNGNCACAGLIVPNRTTNPATKKVSRDIRPKLTKCASRSRDAYDNALRTH